MNSLRKWLYRPKKSDASLLAQFYFADEELNLIAAELDSFDSRKDPERCTALVTQLRSSQDKVLSIIQQMMKEAIPYCRTTRDFRVKFPDDVVQENLAGQLWFGAECLAAGSSIMNREIESASMRPLARALTKNLDSLRCILREQCLTNVSDYTQRIQEALIIFDKLFAEFELSYVSAMVPVKSVKEYETIQEITVLFSETVMRAKVLGYITTDMIDEYDPALMFTIPRLAIVCGLLIYPEGPLNTDRNSWDMSDMFRPFQSLLYKIRELLFTLSEGELLTLERALCSHDEPDFLVSSTMRHTLCGKSTLSSTAQTDNLPFMVEKGEDDTKSCSSGVRSSTSLCCSEDSNSVSGQEIDVHIDVDTLDKTSIEEQAPIADLVRDIATYSRTQVAEPSGEISHSEDKVINVSASCIDICFNPHADDISSVIEPSNKSKCLNKSDSNDSGLHSEVVSNSGSLYTISSCESQHQLISSAISSPIQLGCDAFDNNNEPPMQQCVQEGQHHPILYATSSSLTFPGESENIPASRPSASYVVDEDEESFYSASSGDSPCRNSNSSNEADLMMDICQDKLYLTVGRLMATSVELTSKESRDLLQEKKNYFNPKSEEAINNLCDVSTDADYEHLFSPTNTMVSTCNRTGKSEHLYCCDQKQDTSESAEVNCIADGENVNEIESSDAIQSDCAVFQSSHPTLSLQQDHVNKFTFQRSYSDNNEILRNELFINKSRSCDSSTEPQSTDQNSCMPNGRPSADICDTVGLDENASGSILSDHDEEWEFSQCDRCTQTPHSAINNTHSSKIHHHHCHQHHYHHHHYHCQLSNPTPPPTSSKSYLNSNKSCCKNNPPPQNSSQSAEVGQEGNRNCDMSCEISPDVKETLSDCIIQSTVARISPKPSQHAKETNLDQYSIGLTTCTNGNEAEGESKSLQEAEAQASEEMDCGTGASESSSSDCEWEQESCSSSETSSYNSECHDDEEIALAVQAAELANRNQARARFRSSSDMIHRLFVCISGVADQLQTNFAGDLRNILRVVFNLNCSESVVVEDEKFFSRRRGYRFSLDRDVVQNRIPRDPPPWIPDDQSTMCMSCKTPFTFVRRRHHCRNCGKIFCGRCSSNAVSLPHFGHPKPVRVCNRCFMFQVTPFTMQA